MSRTTVTGYTKNHCTPDSMSVDAFGTYLITKNGNYLDVPAGWLIKEIQLSSVGEPLNSATSTSIIVYQGVVGQPDITIMTAQISDLNNGTLTMIGTDSSPVQNVLDHDIYLMVKTDSGILDYGAVVRLTVKLQLMDYRVPDAYSNLKYPNN
jgi:hypothetical protein